MWVFFPKYHTAVPQSSWPGGQIMQVAIFSLLCNRAGRIRIINNNKASADRPKVRPPQW